MFLTSCVRHHEDHLYMQFAYGRLLDCLHKRRKNIPYKIACKNGLPDDEHVKFET
jgi:hypothetical protein